MREIVLIHSASRHNASTPWVIWFTVNEMPALDHVYKFASEQEAREHVHPLARHHGWEPDSYAVAG